MSKREKIIGIVMIVMIAASAFLLMPDAKKKSNQNETLKVKSASKSKTAASSTKNASGNDDSKELFSLEEAVEKINLHEKLVSAKLNTDPFAELQPSITELSFSDLELSGLHWEEDKPVAIINGQILSQGEEISGFVIDDIRADEVILIKNKRWYVLTFTQ